MFQVEKRNSGLNRAYKLFDLVYHGTVRTIRTSHRNAFVSILINMMQMVVFVLAFYVMFSVLGLRGMALRGDFMVYLMTGIFLFMTHIKTVGAVSGAESSTSPMMKHAPMNTAVAIASAAISQLYIQFLSLFAIMFFYHVLVTPFEVYDLSGVMMMITLSWFTGVSVGLVFYSFKPWAPALCSILSTVYQRANMIASGKMFVANSLSSTMLAMFSWNPLFHCIDQSRGFAFINYSPRNSSWDYALWVGLALLVVGMLGEFFTRKHASISWGARQ